MYNRLCIVYIYRIYKVRNVAIITLSNIVRNIKLVILVILLFSYTSFNIFLIPMARDTIHDAMTIYSRAYAPSLYVFSGIIRLLDDASLTNLSRPWTAYMVKKVSDFSVPSRDATNPGAE
jgi:hypothetical protein